MKMKYEFVVRSVAGEYFAVPIGGAARKFPGMFTLNKVGAFLLETLSTTTDESELVNLVWQKYDVSEETAKQDVHEFIGKMIEMGILEETE